MACKMCPYLWLCNRLGCGSGTLVHTILRHLPCNARAEYTFGCATQVLGTVKDAALVTVGVVFLREQVGQHSPECTHGHPLSQDLQILCCTLCVCVCVCTPACLSVCHVHSFSSGSSPTTLRHIHLLPVLQ